MCICLTVFCCADLRSCLTRGSNVCTGLSLWTVLPYCRVGCYWFIPDGCVRLCISGYGSSWKRTVFVFNDSMPLTVDITSWDGAAAVFGLFGHAGTVLVSSQKRVCRSSQLRDGDVMRSQAPLRVGFGLRGCEDRKISISLHRLQGGDGANVKSTAHSTPRDAALSRRRSGWRGRMIVPKSVE